MGPQVLKPPQYNTTRILGERVSRFLSTDDDHGGRGATPRRPDEEEVAAAVRKEHRRRTFGGVSDCVATFRKKDRATTKEKSNFSLRSLAARWPCTDRRRILRQNFPASRPPRSFKNHHYLNCRNNERSGLVSSPSFLKSNQRCPLSLPLPILRPTAYIGGRLAGRHGVERK